MFLTSIRNVMASLEAAAPAFCYLDNRICPLHHSQARSCEHTWTNTAEGAATDWVRKLEGNVV